jgi:VWFA-related protein
MKRWLLAGAVVAGLVVGPSAQQQPAPPEDGTRSGRGAAPAAPAAGGGAQGQETPPDVLPQGGPQQPTFRGGINFVRVDVIVTDRKQQPVTDLRQEDFEVEEDGKAQAIEQFRLIKVDGAPPPPGEIARSIRSRDDEEREAARDDVRVYVFFLDDYHTRLENSMSVREPLTKFIETQLRPQDLVAVMYPLTPVSELTFTRNHEAVARAIQKFEGRKFDYQPRNQFEYEYWRYPTETVERIRNDVVMSALEGLSVRLGAPAADAPRRRVRAGESVRDQQRRRAGRRRRAPRGVVCRGRRDAADARGLHRR